MARALKMILLFLSLGIMMFPKQMLAIPSSVEVCCCSPASKKAKDSCNTTGKTHQENSCKEDCSNCRVCSSYTSSFQVMEKVNFTITPFSFVIKKQYPYTTPSLSNGENRIWQPPKIG